MEKLLKVLLKRYWANFLNYIDIILLVLVVIGFILGFKDGLVRKIIGLLGFSIAILLAFEFSEDVGEYLIPVFNGEKYLAEFIAGVLIFFSVIFCSAIIKRLVHPVDKVNRFFNQLLGGISGVLQMLFFISGFLLFLNIFNIPNEKTKEQSLSYTPIYLIIPSSIDFILGEESKTKDFIIEYIESKDEFTFPSDSTIIESIDIDSTIFDTTKTD